MSWNYRIVRYDTGEVGLHEVYYTDNKELAARGEFAITVGENVEEIIKSLQMMLRDARRFGHEDSIIVDDAQEWRGFS